MEYQMTEYLRGVLMERGLSRTQADSKAAQEVFNVFLEKNGQDVLLGEVHQQVENMRAEYKRLHDAYDDVRRKIERISTTVETIRQSQETYGALTDQKAMNALTLYASVCNIDEQRHVNKDQSAEGAGYIAYAYLCGEKPVKKED